VTDQSETNQKGKYLNTIEKYQIYKTSKKDLHMNDTNIDTHNPIFEILYKITQHNTIPSPISPHSSQPGHINTGTNTASAVVKTTPHTVEETTGHVSTK
jgi:hypothetical protein